MKTTYYLLFSALLVLSSCVKKDMPGGDLFDQEAALYKLDGTSAKQASFYDLTSISVEREDNNTSRNLECFAKLVKENDKNIEIKLATNPSEVDKYNNVYGTNYLQFPDSLVSYPSSIQINAGNVNSDPVNIIVRISPSLKENAPYLLAVSMQSVNSNINIMNSAKTLFYVIEKSHGIIKKSLPLTRSLYLEIDGSTNVSGLGNTFTMEGLIFVEKFRSADDVGDAQISTFMGTEGRTLLRFGDAGVPGNHLQANGTDIGVDFKLKKWYHIALVVDGTKSVAYLNGQKVSEFNKGGSLGDFFIGRSYNGNRGIVGRISEIRLWKTARTSVEIKENILGADKNSQGLYAYWKMNEVKNNKIEDASGNGKNLLLKGQSDLSGQQTIVLADENGIKIE